MIAYSWRLGQLSLFQGDLSRALSRLERAMGLCRDADLSYYFPVIAVPLGIAYTLGGRVADTIPLLTQALDRVLPMFSRQRASGHFGWALLISSWVMMTGSFSLRSTNLGRSLQWQQGSCPQSVLRRKPSVPARRCESSSNLPRSLRQETMIRRIRYGSTSGRWVVR